jgi:hypothetical protein
MSIFAKLRSGMTSSNAFHEVCPFELSEIFFARFRANSVKNIISASTKRAISIDLDGNHHNLNRGYSTQLIPTMQRVFLAGPLTSPIFTRCALVALSVLSTTKTSFAWTPVSGASVTRTGFTLSAISASRLFSSATMASPSDTCASTLSVVQIPCLDDNYGYLIHDEATGATAAIDTPDAKPYQDELKKRGWKLTHIFNTHQ